MQPRRNRSIVTSATLRAELWTALLSSGAQVLVDTVASVTDAASTTGRRALRVSGIEPSPPGFPPGPSGDQAMQLLAGPLSFLTQTTRQYGPVVGLLMGGERVILVSDQEAAKQVLMDQSDVFIKKGTAFFPGSSLTGNGLLVSDGEVWKRQRRLANPAFRKAAVDTYAGAMVSASADMLTQQWGCGGTRDVYADFNELTLRITLEALFGLTHEPSPQSSHFPSQPLSGHASHPSATSPDQAQVMSSAARGSSTLTSGPEATLIISSVAKAFEFFTKRAGAGMMLPEWLPTWDNLEFGAAVSQLDKVIYALIAERRAEIAASGEQGSDGPSKTRKDLLHNLLLAADEDGSGMTDVALRDELMTLLVAGQETSAIMLSWTCALLAHHPQVQAKAAAEIAAQLEGRTPHASDFRRLPYLEAILLESLRMYAPAYMVGRCACKDAQLGQHKLAAGTTVLVSPFLLHRDTKAWGSDANEFKPERWEEFQSREGYQGFMSVLAGLGPHGSYIPFGGGPRACVGTGFAMMEAFLVMAGILQRFKLSPAIENPAFPVPKPLITLRPEEVLVNIQLLPLQKSQEAASRDALPQKHLANV